jgi:hypothetical protein
LEQNGNPGFVHIASEFNSGIASTGFLHRLDVTGGLGMVSSRDHKLGVGDGALNYLESLENEFQLFVGAPFAKCQDAVLRVAAQRKVRILGPAGQRSVRPNVHIVAAVFLIQYSAIPGHQHRDGIRQQKNSCGE